MAGRQVVKTREGSVILRYIFSYMSQTHCYAKEGARVDAHRVLYHIICCGIEHRQIFLNDIDRDNFLEHLGCKDKGRQILIND